MQCHTNLVQTILQELIASKALSLIRPGFYLQYVLAHDIAHEIALVLRRHCNISVSH